MTHRLLEDFSNIYENVISNGESEIDEIAEEILATIAVSMASEGYTARAIKSFIVNSSEDQLLEYYIDCQVLENLVSEEYIVEQVTELEEGIGSALRLLGKAFMPAVKSAGSALKSTGRVLNVAAKRAVGPQVRAGLSKVKSVITSPAGKIGLGAAALGGAYGLGRMQGGPGLAKGPSTPPATPPAPLGGAGRGPGGSAPGGGKGGGKPSTPSKTDIDKQYRNLIKQGKTKEAEAYGLEAWKKANPKLAARLNPDGTQKGTGQSEMEKQAAELRKISATSPENEALRGSTALASMASSPNKDKLLQSDIAQQSYNRVLNAPKPTPKKEEDKIKKAGEEYGKKAFEDTRDAYSIILDYLISEGHADTISEAHYVMMQMSAEHIQDIVEMDFKIDPNAHRKMQRIEKATELQKRSTGAESEAAGSAVKRLGGSGVQLPPA